jgi:hypothetical protein
MSERSSLHRILTSWDTIPADLKNRHMWLAWRPVEIITKKGERKLDKKPLIAARPERGASSTDPQTWCSYDECRTGCELFGLQPGLALCDGLLGCDIDQCRDPDTGVIADYAWEIIQQFNTYTEVSPSGTGVHMLLWADLSTLAAILNLDAKDLRKKTTFYGGHIEFYDRHSPHYFTITGHRVPHTSEFIEPRQPVFEALYKRVFGNLINEVRAVRVRRKQIAVRYNPFDLAAEDEVVLDLIRRAANAPKFCLLYDEGDWHAVKKVDGSDYDSQSEADLALMTMLGFYTLDAAQLERLFESSALFRGDEKHHDYVARSVETAISKCIDSGQHFNWDYRRTSERQEAQTEYLFALCSKLGMIPKAPAAEHGRLEVVGPADDPDIDFGPYRDDPLYSYMWRDNHGKYLEDHERRKRIRTLDHLMSIVPNQGFFRQFLVVFNKASSVAPLFNLGAALAVAGHVVNRKCYRPAGEDRAYANCYYGLIGPSTEGRKTRALRHGRRALSLLPDYRDTIAPNHFSLQSIMEWFGVAVPKPDKKSGQGQDPTQLAKEIEAAHAERMLTAELNPDLEYTTGVGIWMSEEITDLIREIEKSSNAGCRELILDWYDVPAQPSRSMYRTVSNIVVLPRNCPNIVGCSTQEHMAGVMPAVAIASGLLPRWILLPWWVDEMDYDISAEDVVTQDDIDTLLPHLTKFRRARGAMNPTDECLDFHHEWYERRKLSKPGDHNLAPWYARLNAAVWKFAILFAIDMYDEHIREIPADAMDMAIKWIEEITSRLIRLWPDFPLSVDEEHAGKVYRQIERAGREGVDHTKLLSLLRGKTSFWKPFIDSLEEQSRIRVEDRATATKHKRVYVATRFRS